MRELELIRWIRERAPSGEGVRTGIGDDAAVVEGPGGGAMVITTDLLVEGTHFRPGDPPEDVGYKALAVSISDTAAMGCRAAFAVAAAALPAGRGGAYARALLRGVGEAARRHGVALVGGDIAAARDAVAVCSTVVGLPPPGGRPVLRSGARPGEALLVTGRLGGSGAGRHLRFPPRQPEALALVAEYRVGAMIDVSDGLSTDAGHLARESGVRLILDPGRIPVSEAARETPDPLASALHDGEDFELLFTLSAAEAERAAAAGLAGTPVTRIGEVREGRPGVWFRYDDGREEPVPEGGYEHFRDG